MHSSSAFCLPLPPRFSGDISSVQRLAHVAGLIAPVQAAGHGAGTEAVGLQDLAEPSERDGPWLKADTWMFCSINGSNSFSESVMQTGAFVLIKGSPGGVRGIPELGSRSGVFC